MVKSRCVINGNFRLCETKDMGKITQRTCKYYQLNFLKIEYLYYMQSTLN